MDVAISLGQWTEFEHENNINYVMESGKQTERELFTLYIVHGCALGHLSVILNE